MVGNFGCLRGIVLITERELSGQSLDHQLDAAEMLAKAIMQILPDAATFSLGNFQNLFFEQGVLLFLLLALSNVGANRHVLLWFSALIDKGKDSRIHPVDASVLCAVADFAIPNSAATDPAPEVA